MFQFSNSLSLINASCSRHNPRKTSAKSNTTPQISQRNPELGSKVPPHRRQIPNRGRSYLRCSRSMIRCVVAMCASRVFVRGPSSRGLSLRSPVPASIEGHFPRERQFTASAAVGFGGRGLAEAIAIGNAAPPPVDLAQGVPGGSTHMLKEWQKRWLPGRKELDHRALYNADLSDREET